MPTLMAYLDDGKPWTVADLRLADLSCINYAFAKIDGLKLTRELQRIDLINAEKPKYPNLKTCISIGGWTADGFSDAVATAANRAVFTQNIIEYMRRYDFDGVDLDWEYPGMDTAGIVARPEDAANFLAFVKGARAALDAAGAADGRYYRLTAAIGAAEPLLATMSPDDKHEYVQYLDYLNVMTYDMRGSWTKLASHHTNLLGYTAANGNLSAQQAVNKLLAVGVPAAKIVIGSAFYSRDWFEVSAKAAPLGQPTATLGTHTTNYNELKLLLAEHPANVHWDDEAKAPYYCDGDRFSSYDDARSMAAKAEYAVAHGLCGLMFWEYSLDLSGTLVQAAADVFNRQA
ncbi:glycoside hydrolase family 18 protein [Lacticaseibacillus parakribbianus]|uniref:glycoside hydrolase family 18 protein n=1 Tax=Lacticaseibacillus parakribbianus TaxID=2970927 RepID=UPI0021CB2E8F|nr:glycosyl hydrolase family 18 protein [Lacticaseibacillus parakribbianus]